MTLDEDVAAALRELAVRQHLSFKQALNATLRSGLSAPVGPKPYSVPTRHLGLRSGVDLDKALRLAGEVEDDEIVRKLELRK
ncbi:MAG TPA: antitoxin [Mycobacteriales bacterium]|nr:antitoxin [Mycobacteriales bacterium]